jgi:hypothetical protein
MSPSRKKYSIESIRTKHFPFRVNEWQNWWKSQSLIQKLLPAILGFAYVALIGSVGTIRSEHPLIACLVAVLWYLGPAARNLFKFLLPLILVAVIYDSMRYYSDYIRGSIHVTEPYDFDKYFFGINTADGRLTPNEWWQKHTSPILDLYTGFFYLFFITIYVLTSMYLCFWLPFKGTQKRSPEWIQNQAFRPMWGFFWLNMIGYSTYYWYAAAPPWYVAAHGLGPADLSVGANAAGCLRFDALLGTHFFTEFYGRSADVFGAIPSLHVAYPLQAVYYANRYGALRKFSLFFYLSMCFSAVYLNHHYILDILWGSTYALIVCVTLDWFFKIRHPKTR